MPGHDQVSEILRVDLSIRADRDGCIGGAEREIQEETLCQDASLRDRVEVPIFAVRIDDSVRVDRDVVDAELESVGVVRHAGDRIVRVANAALRVGVLPLPFGNEQGVELRHEIRLGIRRISRGSVGRADVVVVAVAAGLAVVILLEDDRIGSVVGVDAAGRIPAEVVRAKNLAGGAELQEVALSEVVTGVGAVEHGSVRRDSRTGGGVLVNPRGRQFERRYVYKGAKNRIHKLVRFSTNGRKS